MYLSERNADCIGCAEKHEFVLKAQSVAHLPPKNKPKAREEGKAKRKPEPKKTSRPKETPRNPVSAQSSMRIEENMQLIRGSVVLLVVAGLYTYQQIASPIRKILLAARGTVWSRDVRCVLTMSEVKDPYRLPCCKQICERDALATWMGKSRYFRKRDDECFQRVAPCPHCRHMLEPAAVGDLLRERKVIAANNGDVEMDSGIPDPAFPSGAVHQNFILMKTRKEFDELARQFHATDCEAGNESTPDIDSQSASEGDGDLPHSTFPSLRRGFLL